MPAPLTAPRHPPCLPMCSAIISALDAARFRARQELPGQDGLPQTLVPQATLAACVAQHALFSPLATTAKEGGDGGFVI